MGQGRARWGGSALGEQLSPSLGVWQLGVNELGLVCVSAGGGGGHLSLSFPLAMQCPPVSGSPCPFSRAVPHGAHPSAFCFCPPEQLWGMACMAGL